MGLRTRCSIANVAVVARQKTSPFHQAISLCDTMALRREALSPTYHRAGRRTHSHHPQTTLLRLGGFFTSEASVLVAPVWYCGPTPAQTATMTMNIQTRTSKVRALRGDAGGQQEATVALQGRKNTSPTFQPEADDKGLDGVGAARPTDNLRRDQA